MARFGFSAVAALVLGVALALWVAPDVAEPPEATPEAEASEAQPSELPAEGAPQPAPSAPAPSSRLASVRETPPAEAPDAAVTSPEPMAVAPEPTPPVAVGVPTLPEEQREISVVAGFEPDPGEPEVSATDPTPSVDPERSGELIRRMLVLYRQMRD
jgi:hypothetical protein